MGGDGIGPMAGPAYQYDSKSRSRFVSPRYYGVPLFYEWTRDYIKEFRLNRPNGTRLEEIRHVPAFVDNPMDMEFGPDGALYVLEYGDGFFSENPDAQLSRIDFVRGNYTPILQVAAEPTTGLAHDGHLLERRHNRSRRRPDHLRVGLRHGRDGGLHRTEPDLHL